MRERLEQVEEENSHFAERYIEIEEENNNLANLYVASYQLHSTCQTIGTLCSGHWTMENYPISQDG